MTLQELNEKLATINRTYRAKAFPIGDRMILINGYVFLDDHVAAINSFCEINNMTYTIEAADVGQIQFELTRKKPPS